jgi:hypothetical protein
MSDTPREALEAALVEEQTESTPTQEVEAKESEQVETFADTPENLESMTPQELLEVKKNWERSYTKKRQEETARIKEYEMRIAELEKASQQGAQLQNPVNQMNAAEAKEQLDLGNMTLDQYTDYMRQMLLDEAKQIARSEFETLTKEQREEANQEKLMQDFLSVDSRVDEHSPTYDRSLKTLVQNTLAEALDAYYQEKGTSIGFDAKKIASEVIAKEDERIDQIIKSRTKQSTQAAELKANKFRKSNLSGTTAESSQIGAKSIRDVLSETLDEQG